MSLLFRKEFYVSNPSPYKRSDYVEVDLSHLGIPDDLESFKLFRLWEDSKEEISYQVDKIYGSNNRKRVLTFLSTNTPPAGDFDYQEKSAAFLIEEGEPNESISFKDKKLKVHHYYSKARLGEPSDGFNLDWDPNRDVRSIKLFSDAFLEVDFMLVPSQTGTVDYSGCVTSISLEPVGGYPPPGFSGRNKEILAPLHPCWPQKWWDKIYQLVFFPLPWELKWFQRIPMLGKKYKLVYSNSGSMRAVVTVKSEDLKISYNPRPYFEPFELTCNLYRVLYIYPDKPYYLEEIFVLSNDENKEGKELFISFRPYFSSYLYSEGKMNAELSRFEHIPDYFAIWKEYLGFVNGYGFASDSHVRGIELNGEQVNWRLQSSHHKKCLHYFMFKNPFYGYKNKSFDDQFNFKVEDRFHTLGHLGWYEKIFKPLEVIPLQRIYPIPVEEA